MKQTLLSALVLTSLLITGCGGDSSSTNDPNNMAKSEDKAGVGIEITKAGDGAVAKEGSNVLVHYVGTLEDGTQFDSSRDRGTPFPFTVGGGQVIKGWDIGVAGMKVGETRVLTIPPALGYGESGIGPIPANATLIFEVELVEIKG